MTFDLFMIATFGCALVALGQWLSILLCPSHERMPVKTRNNE